MMELVWYTNDVFLSLSSKTDARARQDLYDRKQYRFCPHALLQSMQSKSSSKGALGKNSSQKSKIRKQVMHIT